jgi:hypothetical protein
MQVFPIFREDCCLEPAPSRPGFNMMITCDGDVLFHLPEACPADYAWTILDLMNRAWEDGRVIGRREKIREFKQVLEDG